MEFVKSWKFMVIIVGVLTVVALSGVVYGVLSHTEPGFAETTPPWDREDMPLGLCVSTYASEGHTDPSDLDNTIDVIGTINARLGFDVYEISGDDCDVELIYGVPAEMGWQDPGGTATMFDTSCMAEISNVHGEVRDLVVYHELGHCLGLAHDDFESSIMRRVQRETPDGAFPPWISDWDRELLRVIYGPE